MEIVRSLHETDSYVLFAGQEDILLFDKNTNKNLWRTSIDGNVNCGLIGLSNQWTIIGGKNLIVWSENKIQQINDSELMWIHEMRQIGDFEIEMLIDPWSEKSAIWKFNIKTFVKSKIKEFNDYQNRSFQEKIEW